MDLTTATAQLTRKDKIGPRWFIVSVRKSTDARWEQLPYNVCAKLAGQIRKSRAAMILRDNA